MGKCVFFGMKESGGWGQHLIAKFSTLGRVAKSATFFIFLMFFTSPAQATAPEVKYMFIGSGTYTPVTSRQAACVAFSDYMTDMFTSPRVDPDAVSEEPNLVGPVAGIRCLYNLVSNGQVDARSPGLAYCSPTPAGGGEFVIDKRSDTCLCPVGKKYYPDVDKCVTETPVPEPKAPPGKPSDNGPSCGGGAPQPKCGEPINPGTGNMWHIEDDYTSASPISALAIRRTYNSSPFNWDAAVVRSFGARWTQPFDAVLKAEKLPAVGTSYATCFKRDDTGTVSRCETASPSSTLPLQAVSIVRGDGKRHFFKLTDGVWKGDATNSDTLTPVFNSGKTAIDEWTYQAANGDMIERYSGAGQLISQTFRNGVTQRFTYSNGATNDSNVGRNPANAPACGNVQAGPLLPAGKLMCVTDSLGFKLHFEYDGKGRITKAIDPAGEPYAYEYDGVSGGCLSPDANNAACSANNLTKVTYPDATSRTYMYNEAAHINNGAACPGMPGVGNGFGNLLNAWTGYIDENGDRHISWTYDCLGRATSSERADGVKKVKIAYNADESYTSAVVEHYTGLPLSPITTSTTYSFGRVLGSVRNTSINKPCIECGDYAARTYDVNGNDSTLKDWKGNLSCFAYDLSRNLETTRIEGGASTASCTTLLAATSLTAPMRKVNTLWHVKYRLPSQISEPKKRITYVYDNAGNLLTKTEQATTDETGVLGFNATVVGLPRKWTYEVNGRGQVLTVTGPRTDIVDRTTFTYDAAGNLETTKDVLNRTTLFSKFDKHGNAQLIEAPNGVTTDLVFSPRGKLLSKIVRTTGLQATTIYEYDRAGNMKKITLPDNSIIKYTYDAAHRLTAITDSRSNRIDYVLDLTGNRVREEVRDPNGTLARQISRTFDTMGRMTSQSGAAQ